MKRAKLAKDIVLSDIISFTADGPRCEVFSRSRKNIEPVSLVLNHPDDNYNRRGDRLVHNSPSVRWPREVPGDLLITLHDG